MSGHEFLYELSKAFSQEQDKSEFIILNITILTAIYNHQKEMKETIESLAETLLNTQKYENVQKIALNWHKFRNYR